MRTRIALLVATLALVVQVASAGADPPAPDDRPTAASPLMLEVETTVDQIETFQVMDLHGDDAVAARSMGTKATVVCKSVTHKARHAGLKLDGKVRFCYNTTNPPYVIQGDPSLSATAKANWPTSAKSVSHSKTDGGSGKTFVKTKAKAKFCTPDPDGGCPGYDVLTIRANHKNTGATSATASYHWEGN